MSGNYLNESRYVGSKTVIDENGNELHLDMIVKKVDRLDHVGWRRIVLADLLSALDQIGNQKIKVLDCLIANMGSDNTIYLNQREIAKISGVSLQTVNITIQALQDSNLLKKIKHKYILNTQIVASFGSKERNTALCIQYDFTDGANRTSEREYEASAQAFERKAIYAQANAKAYRDALKNKKNSTKKNNDNLVA